MALTQAQIQTAFQNSLGRAPSANELNSYFSVSQSGALTNQAIFQTISNSQEADLIADPVIRFYQAAFGRVPDQAGLQNAENYVRAFTPSAATYQNLAAQFTQSQEFQNTYGSGNTVDAAFVQALYTNILGRQGSGAEIAGYTSGSNGYTTRAQVFYAISQSNEAQSISNAAVNGFELNAAQGTATYTGTLFTAANGAPNGPTSSASTFTLTQNIDNLPGTNGNDTFIGDNTGLNPSIQPGDTINGGDGIDTARLFLTGGNSSLNATSVEIIDVQAQGASVFTATNIAGATTVISDRSTANLQFNDVQNNVAVKAVGTTSGLGVTFGADKLGGSATVAVQVSDSGNAASSTAELITLTAQGADKISGVSIDATGTSSVALRDLAAGGVLNSLSSLTVTGAGKLAVVHPDATGFANLATVDASKNTGGLSIDLTGDTKGVAFTGGTGNDRVYFGATEFTAADKLIGGGGTDTVVLGEADLTTDALTSAVSATTGFTVLGSSSVGDIKIDASKFANFTGFDVANPIGAAGAASSSVTISGLKSSGESLTLEHNVTGTVQLTVGTDSGNDAITVNVTDNLTATNTITVNKLDASQFEKATLNISDNFTVTTETDVGPNGVLTIAGKGDVNLGTLKSIAADATAQNLTVDASGLTGKLTVVTGAGNDVITVGTKGGVITAGLGADTVTLSGAGNDLINVAVGDSGTKVTATNITGLDVYSNFKAGAGGDVLKFAGGGDTFQALTTVQANNVGAAGNLKAAADLATQYTANNKVTAFDFGGSTYVLDNNTNGAAAAGYDATKEVLVKIVGSTAAQFDLTNFA